VQRLLLHCQQCLTSGVAVFCCCCCRYELQIDFLDAVFGCKKELEIMHLTGAV
jgi:hypothetical protein